MPTAVTTQLDSGQLVLEAKSFRDELLTLAGAATVKAGTILARDSVSGKLVLFVVGGATNENGIPKVILPYEVVAAGAGDKPVRALMGGRVVRRRLVIHADGDATNVTGAVVDKLRDYGFQAEEVAQLSKADNATG